MSVRTVSSTIFKRSVTAAPSAAIRSQNRGIGHGGITTLRHLSSGQFAAAPASRLPRLSGGRARDGMRSMSSRSNGAQEAPAEELTPSVLSQAEYERISEEDMETLSENLGALCEQVGRESWEVDYSSGVLTLSIPPHGTYVLNKQPPNQQIWISSPISGPSRFGYVLPTPSDPSTTGPMSSESQLGDDGSAELRGAWTHFRRPGVTLGGLVEGELRVLGVGKDNAEGWVGVGIK